MSADASTSGAGGPRTGIAAALMIEVSALLVKLTETGEGGAVDLRSLPMTDADRSELDERLGHGEVHAELSVAGKSEVWETAYAGVWRVRHLGEGDRLAAEEIVICSVPEILVTHPADLHAAARRLASELSAEQHSGRAEEDLNV